MFVCLIIFNILISFCIFSQAGHLPPVETKKSNANYQPAFLGQTRIAGTKTKTFVQSNILTEQLTRPWGIVNLPDGRLLITEKGGMLRIITHEGKMSMGILGFPELDTRNQGGLLDLALAPNFKVSRVVYFTLTEKEGAGSVTSLGRGRLSVDEKKIENFEIIFRALPAYGKNMNVGSRVIFDRRGNIFFSVGDRFDPAVRVNAQALNSTYGKVFYMTADGEAVKGNPFAGRPNAFAQVYSYGHRNIQGLAIHPLTGDVWASEMGPRGGDELNLIKAGANYGWPVISYGIEYSGAAVGRSLTQQPGMEQPIYYWDPIIAPSGIAFYDSKHIPEWENNLFICGLGGKQVARLVIENNRVVAEERLLDSEDQRFRDVTVGLDGNLYFITDEGRLYRLGR